MDELYQLLRLLRSVRSRDILTIVIAVLGFMIARRRWKR